MSNEHNNNNAPAVPQGYEIHEIPADYSGLVWLEGQVRAVARLAQAATGPQGWTDADSDAARLALELECLLMDTKDLSVVSKWWASANDALELHRQRLAATPAPAPAQERCHLCDCTGDIHDATGEWRGECPYCKPEQEVTQSEPIYQLQRGDGSWIDQDKASYDYNAQYGINTIRIVYTAPAPAQEPYTTIDLGHGKWEVGAGTNEGLPCIAFGRNGTGKVGEPITTEPRQMSVEETFAVITFANVAGLDVLQDKMDQVREEFFPGTTPQFVATPAPAPAQEVATLSLSAEDVHAAFTKNFPKSRISQAWINFAADIAQAIAARAAKPAQEVPSDPNGWCQYVAGMVFGWLQMQEGLGLTSYDEDRFVEAIAGIVQRRLWAYKPAQEVGLTDDERVRCLIASGCIGTVKMTYDSGPYEITRTSINASRLIDAIIAALRAKGGKHA